MSRLTSLFDGLTGVVVVIDVFFFIVVVVNAIFVVVNAIVVVFVVVNAIIVVVVTGVVFPFTIFDLDDLFLLL